MPCSMSLSIPSQLRTAPLKGGQNPQQQQTANRRQQEEAIRTEDDRIEAKVIDHENAHAAIAGNQPVYQYNERGRIVGGYVPVTMNPNSRSSLERAQAAAEAPGGDMSSQDAAVASQAAAMLSALDAKAYQGRAQVAMQRQVS